MGICNSREPEVGYVASQDHHDAIRDGMNNREITMDDDNAGWQGQSSTCGIYALNNVLDDALRSEHGVSDYDPEQGALLMRKQNYTYNGSLIEDSGTSMEGLIDQVNESIEGGMVLPTHDGRGVTCHLECKYNDGLSNVSPGQVVLATEYSGGNHFMEIASFDGETITTVNSWQGQEEKTVPDDDTFSHALGTYDIVITDVVQPGDGDSDSDADSGGDFLGKYVRDPAENDWHTGSITSDSGQFTWLNDAGVSWSLQSSGGDELQTGDDCPYTGENFTLQRDGDRVTGFLFQGELYVRR